MRSKIKYKIEDYQGTQIFFLTPLRAIEERSRDNSFQWLFQCVCGKTVEAPPSRVIGGHIKSCGCMRYRQEHNPRNTIKKNYARIDPSDLIGKKNNRLSVVGAVRPEGGGRLKLECLCDCGNTVFVYPYQFKSGDVQSCGCARFGHSDCHKGNTSRRTHGLTKNPFYKKWNDMVRRCHNPNEPAYKFYGALGISVCEEWRHTPNKFIEWCEATCPAGEKVSLDRIDGTKGYSPDNCRWATQIQQVHNLKNNRFVMIHGETHCVSEWCRLNGLSPGAIYKRVQKGQSFEDAISELICRKTERQR